MSSKTKFSKFMDQVREETRRITWPTKQSTITATIMIIVVSIIMAFFFFVVDTSITGLLGLIFGWVE